jgi:predicted nucleotidyltransferase
MARTFEYRQARELARVFEARGVHYLFLGKGAAILLGFPDTTQDADVFVEKSHENARALLGALADLGFELTESQQEEIARGKDFVQIRSGPFDVDLIFAPDGIESFAEADARARSVEGIRVCSLDDIIRSKQAAGRAKDRETLPRLIAFRDWLRRSEG